MPTALASWMTDHGPELRSHLRRMLRSDADAEDVLQEVWVSAADSPPDDGPGSNVRAWLYRVATNAALDHLARERRRRRALAAVDGAGLAGSPAPPDAAVEADAERRLRERVRREIALLPPKQREAVWFRWVEEMEYPEVARRLGSSLESARANVYHGLQRLRVALADLEGPAEAPAGAGAQPRRNG